MRRTIRIRLILMAILSLAMACKSKKAIVAPPAAVKTDSVVVNKNAERIAFLRSKDMVFNTLALKGKADLNMAGASNTVTVNVRVQRDRKIWMSITALLGIEVGRAVITPDSIMVLNRLQSTYIRKPFSYVYRYTSGAVTFQMLQDILTGNTIDTLLRPDATLALNDKGVWRLSGNQAALGFDVLFNTFQKSSEVNMNDVRAGQALKVVYGEYQKVNEYLFPTTIRINSMSGTRRVNLDFDFSKVESNVPVDMSFTVPRRFELIN
jgi:predicted small lipoprotein YifL